MSIKARHTQNKGTVYDVRLRDPHGRVYGQSFRTKREAERWQATEKAAHALGTWVDPRRASDVVADVAAEWLDANPMKAEGTRERDSLLIKKHVLPMLGQFQMKQVTPGDVQRVVNLWAAQLAPATVRRNYQVLKAIMTFAVDTDRILRSPCRRVRLPERRESKKMVLSPGQLHDLVAAIDPEMAPMVYLGAVLGLRWGECAGLRVGGIDFLAKTVTIDTQLTRGTKGRSVVGRPKWNSTGTMAAPDELLEVLADHLRLQCLTGADTDAFVFTMPGGDPLRYENWRRRTWLPACERAGLPGFRFHWLRTTNSTAMVALGVDIKTAQTRSRHKSSTTTLHYYVQPTEEADRRAAQLLGSHFFRFDASRHRELAVEHDGRTTQS